MPSFQMERAASPRSVLRAAESQWIFSEEELTRTPSALEGLPIEKERLNRGKGVNFITQVGIMLKLPQLTLSAASVLLHRFFMRYSMVEIKGRKNYHYYSVAATALFLASKIEENCRKMRELVIACCKVAQKNSNLVIDEQSKEYWRWRDTILHDEDIMLEAICFDLSLEPPYKTLFDFLHQFGEQDNKQLRNSGWAFLNDSNMTELCLLFPSRTIAATSLYCAAKHCDVSFRDRGGRAWWEVVGVDLREIRRASNYMATTYLVNPLRHSENTYSRTPEDGDPLFAKTRARESEPPGSPSPSQGPGPGPERGFDSRASATSSQDGHAPYGGKRSREEDERRLGENGSAVGTPGPAWGGDEPEQPPERERKRVKTDEGQVNGRAEPGTVNAPVENGVSSGAGAGADSGVTRQDDLSEEGEVEES